EPGAGSQAQWLTARYGSCLSNALPTIDVTKLAASASRLTTPPGSSLATLCQRLQNELAHRLERIEYPFAGHGDGLEIGCALDPRAIGLFDQVLAGVIRIRRHSPLARIGHFPARIHRGLQILDRCGV